MKRQLFWKYQICSHKPVVSHARTHYTTTRCLALPVMKSTEHRPKIFPPIKTINKIIIIHTPPGGRQRSAHAPQRDAAIKTNLPPTHSALCSRHVGGGGRSQRAPHGIPTDSGGGRGGRGGVDKSLTCPGRHCGSGAGSCDGNCWFGPVWADSWPA